MVIAIIAILAAMLLPALAKAKRTAQRGSCVNNIKQVGLSFRIWAGDNGEQYPMSVSTASQGAMESVVSQKNQHFGTYGITNVYCVMADILKNPNVLICPSDLARVPQTSFQNLTSNTNLSYFVCGDASDKYPKMILTGDRNIAATPDRRYSWCSRSQHEHAQRCLCCHRNRNWRVHQDHAFGLGQPMTSIRLAATWAWRRW